MLWYEWKRKCYGCFIWNDTELWFPPGSSRNNLLAMDAFRLFEKCKSASTQGLDIFAPALHALVWCPYLLFYLCLSHRQSVSPRSIGTVLSKKDFGVLYSTQTTIISGIPAGLSTTKCAFTSSSLFKSTLSTGPVASNHAHHRLRRAIRNLPGDAASTATVISGVSHSSH